MLLCKQNDIQQKMTFILPTHVVLGATLLHSWVSTWGIWGVMVNQIRRRVLREGHAFGLAECELCSVESGRQPRGSSGRSLLAPPPPWSTLPG